MKIKNNNTLKEVHELYKNNSGTAEYIGEMYKSDGNGGYEHIFSAGYDTTVTGTPPITLPNARPKPISNLTVSGNTKRTVEIDNVEYIIPDNFVLLDYIQSSGTQYISTGVAYDVNKTLVNKAKMCFTAATSGFSLNGWDAGGAFGINSAGALTIGAQGLSTNIVGKMIIATQTINSGSSTQTVLDYDIEGTTGTLTRPHASISSYANLDYTLFACVSNTTIDYYCNSKVYYWKMYQDNVLVRAFYPAKRTSDNEIGMYDFVTGTFFTNAGSGSFTAGNEAPNPNLIEGVKGVGDNVNLFDKDNANILTNGYIPNSTAGSSGRITSSQTARTIYIPCQPSTAYSLYFGTAYTKRIACSSVIPALNVSVNNIMPNFTDNTISYTTDSTANYLVVQLFVDTDMTAGATVEGAIQTLVIVEGSTAIPYGYKLPILKAENCGVVDLGTLSWEYNSTNKNFYNSGGIPFAPASSSSTTGNGFMRGYTVVSDRYIGDTTYNDVDMLFCFNTNKVFKVRNLAYTNATSFKSAMSGVYLFYQRTTDTSWTAPTTTNIYLNEPLKKVGTYADIVNATSGVVTKNVGVKVLDGTESWTKELIDSTHYRFRCLVSDIEPCPDNAGRTTILCSQYIASQIPVSWGSGDVDYAICRYNNTRFVYIYDTDFDNASSTETTWRAHLTELYNAGTPVTIYYPLATPTTENITSISLSTAKGINYLDENTEVKASSMSATYRKRTK